MGRAERRRQRIERMLSSGVDTEESGDVAAYVERLADVIEYRESIFERQRLVKTGQLDLLHDLDPAGFLAQRATEVLALLTHRGYRRVYTVGPREMWRDARGVGVLFKLDGSVLSVEIEGEHGPISGRTREPSADWLADALP